MNISRKIGLSVYGAVSPIRESFDDALNNTLDVSVYKIISIDDTIYSSVWNSFDGGLITSVEKEIWDYEYDKAIN
jgi:hypothetical protein